MLPHIHKSISFEVIFSPKELRKTWKRLKQEIHLYSPRDIVDWLDQVYEIEVTFEQIRQNILNGEYTLYPKSTYELGRGQGIFRTLTLFHIRDLFIYRHISDLAFSKANRHKVKCAYFLKRSETKLILGKRSLKNKIIIVTDISYYHGSIYHDSLFNYLRNIGLPKQVIHLLEKLYSNYEINKQQNHYPRVGIPIDDFDLNSIFSHIYLYDFDKQMISFVEEKNYIRNLDDFYIICDNYTQARKIINTLVKLLSERNLRLNKAKTLFLNEQKARVFFELDIHKQLDDFESIFDRLHGYNLHIIRLNFLLLWNKIKRKHHSNEDNWIKILKRIYNIATRLNVNILEKRALQDLVKYPKIAKIIFEYYSLRNRDRELFKLFHKYCQLGENLYEMTEANFFEASLLLNPSQKVSKMYSKLAIDIIKDKSVGQTHKSLGKAMAILLLYWFDGSFHTMKSLFTRVNCQNLPEPVFRAWIACMFALKPSNLSYVFNSSVYNQNKSVLQLRKFLTVLYSEKIQDLDFFISEIAHNFISQKHIDARFWLLFEIFSHSRDERFRKILTKKLTNLKKFVRTDPEMLIAERIQRNLKIS